MKIIEILGYQLETRLAEPIGNALTFFDRRGALLVEVRTDSGISGWGEAWSAPVATEAIIRRTLAPRLLGQDPRGTQPLWRAMAATLGYYRRGIGLQAISALDMALWDIAARAQDRPLSALFGGALRDRLLAYASAPFLKPGGHPYRTYQAEAEILLRQGFRAIKPRAGFDPRADGEMTAALRRLAGPDTALMIDFNQGYTAAAAIEAAKRCEGSSLLWIEEPVVPDDLPGYRAVAATGRTTLAGGEALAGLPAFRELLATGAVGVLQPDIAVCGGFTAALAVAALAEAHEIPVVPHVWGTTVNFHAALQFAAVLPSARGGGPAPYPFFEFDRSSNPLRTLLGETPIDAAGMIAIPEGPGLGLDLTAAHLEPHVVGHWIERA